MIDIMRTVHGAYAPDTERFGARLETFFIGLCVAMADIEGKPLSVAKITGYMGVPRTTVIRRLNQLQKWGLIDRRGRRYYTREKTLNSLIGMRSYQQVRHILSKAIEELTGGQERFPARRNKPQGSELVRLSKTVNSTVALLRMCRTCW